MHTRRTMLALVLGTAGVVGRASAQAGPQVTVWKDLNCGCCGGWVDHLRRNGFAVTVVETADVDAIKRRQRVPEDLASCHTAIVERYTIEGHVPAMAILQFLAAAPAARGLAVPGMPIGSPGMEGGKPEVYDVVQFADGTRRTFARYLGDKPI